MASNLSPTISGSNSLSEYYASLSLSREFESIRVLDVENANGPDDHEIRGSLRVVNLVDKPNFVALSYVWGTFAIPKHTISCGPYSIEVTSNCWSALYHLRQRFGAMTIWIDSICINQDDDSEKSSQIPLMTAIYSEAESVCIWLGDGTDESDIAMDYFLHAGFQDLLARNGDVTYKISRGVFLWKAMWKAYVQRIRHIATLRRGLCFSFSRSTLSRGARNVRTDKQLMDGVSDLLEREWSRRVWTLQEVALAIQPLICCGTKILPWGSLVYGLIFLDVVSNTGRFRSLDEKIPQDACYRWRRIVTLWVAIQFSRQDENETHVDDVLQRPTVPESLEEYTKFLKTTKWRMNF